MSIFHHLNIMRKARKHGHLFPAMGQRPKPAPMGSSQPNTHGSWLRRIRDEAYWFRHSNHSIDLPDWPKLHILHLTDVHLRDTGPFLDRIIVEITGLNPDIIVITGDLVTKDPNTDEFMKKDIQKNPSEVSVLLYPRFQHLLS